MAKVLVTGASGFIGSYLVQGLLDRGLEVYAGIRSTSSKNYLQDDRIHFLELNLNRRSDLEETLKSIPFEYVIHNAGITKASKKSTYFEVNYGLTKNLVEALQNVIPALKKFTLISSLAAYGPADNQKEGIVSRNSTPQPVTNYGESKLAAENYLQGLANFPYAIVRPTAVFGPRDKDILTVFKMIQQGLELMIGSKPQQLTFIYVKDLIRAILDITLSGHKKVDYFITDGNSYSAQEFNQMIKKELGKKTLSFALPLNMVKIVALVNEKIAGLLGTYPALNLEKVKELKCQSWICDIGPLEQEIQFKPKYSMQEAVRETVHWYQQNNWI